MAAPPTRSTPSPDDDAVAAWLRRLSERQEAGRSLVAAVSTPAAPTATGPVNLTPMPADDDVGTEPFAEPWFLETLRSVRRSSEPSADKLRDVHRVLSRNVECYLQFTRRRLSYLYQGLRAKDRATFSAIPWLLHHLVPGTPGHISSQNPTVPHGLRNFDANLTITNAVHELFPKAKHQRIGLPQRPAFRALFAMGSVGSIGHSGGSDIDYWLVYEEKALSAPERLLLQRRVDEIEVWARDRGLDAHFFLVDVERVRRDDFGKASADVESSGSAMGRLLKEEFYRTAIYLAGDLPLWWLSPLGLSDAEYDRLSELVCSGTQVIPGASFVDLGNVGPIDRGEFLGAALWQINKSLKSPFKSLLKMALLERYLDPTTEGTLLCEVLKRRVFEGERAPQYTDPYVLLFDAISEHYAQKGDWSAFRLIQKCFYLKVGLKLSSDRKERDAFLQRFRVMRAYIMRWGWDRDLLADLDSMEHWSADRVDALGQAIRQFMLSTYRHLVGQARSAHARIDEEDVMVLGRRLYACFADEPGKVSHLFTYFLKEPRVEERIVVLEVPQAPASRRWEAHRRLVRGQFAGRDKAMHTGADLAEIAAWLVFNGLFAQNSVVSLLATVSRASVAELRYLLERFHGMFESPDPFAIPPTTFLEPRRLARVALVANFDLAREPEDVSDKAGVFYLPENWDILNYGRGRSNQVTQVTLVGVNNWGEMLSLRFAGEDAVTQAMRALYRRIDPLSPTEHPPELFVPHGRQFQSLRNRLGRLLESCQSVVAAPMPPGTLRAFAYEVGGRFQVIRRLSKGVRVVRAQSLRGVARQFGVLGPGRLESQFDPLSPGLGDFRALVDRARLDREAEVLIAWRGEREGGRIIVRDEVGRLFTLEVATAQLDRELARTFRRIVYHLRGRVKSAAELRKVVRVYELRDGRTLGSQTSAVEDTARVIGLIQQPRTRKTDIWLRGDLREGRTGLSFRFGNEVFSARQYGRAFALELVKRVLRDHSPFEPDLFTIDASDVVFADAREGAPAEERGIVRHLRLIAIFERVLQRALAVYQGGAGRTLRSSRGFRRAPSEVST